MELCIGYIPLHGKSYNLIGSWLYWRNEFMLKRVFNNLSNFSKNILFKTGVTSKEVKRTECEVFRSEYSHIVYSSFFGRIVESWSLLIHVVILWKESSIPLRVKSTISEWKVTPFEWNSIRSVLNKASADGCPGGYRHSSIFKSARFSCLRVVAELGAQRSEVKPRMCAFVNKSVNNFRISDTKAVLGKSI